LRNDGLLHTPPASRRTFSLRAHTASLESVTELLLSKKIAVKVGLQQKI
jgi:hypothetical protein